MKKFQFNKFKNKLTKKRIIIIVLILIVIAVLIFLKLSLSNRRIAPEAMSQVPVTRRDITATITGTAVVRPKDEYSVTSLVTGEVLSCKFEEGDFVNKDDVLYSIDASDIEKDIQSAELAVQKAQQSYDDAIQSKSKTADSNENSLKSAYIAVDKAELSYDDAVKSKEKNTDTNQINLESAELALQKAQISYDDAQRTVENLNVKSNVQGIVGEILVEKGEQIASGRNIARIYDASSLQIKVPFIENDALKISVGQSATLTVIGSGETLSGTVTAINTASEIKNGYIKVRNVTIRVDSPGALSPSDKATAKIGDIYCNDAGVFEYYNEKLIVSKASGTVESININRGNVINVGDTIVILESESAISQRDTALITLKEAEINLKNARANLDDYTSDSQIANAEFSVKDAEINLDNAERNLDDYASDSQIKNAKIAVDDALINLEKLKDVGEDYKITSPISGQVITKNTKAGDKIDATNSMEPLAVIYDMSTLEFELMIDELDINKVSVGQEVKITADALNGKEYTGYVSKVSIDGEEANGVTSYPVSVSISDFDDDLLPGMNIDAEIEVGSVTNVLAVPKSAVTRDNIIYVVGEKEDVMDDAPEGYKSVKVETGLNDGNYIEIISGLSEGDIVKVESVNNSSDFPAFGPGAGMPGGGMPGGGMPGGGAPR